jgi:superoxide reductase
VKPYAIAAIPFVLALALTADRAVAEDAHMHHGTAAAASDAEDPAPEITPAFAENKTAYDPKHTPKITAPDTVTAGEWFDVTVEIGDGARHPSLAEHFVRYIAIYNGDVEIARTYLHPVYSSPKVTYTIRLKEDATIRAMEEANHTAGWIASKQIKVEH